jgi:predicted transcriptional regulator of viral defense system
MVKKLNSIQVREKLINKDLIIFTPLQFRELFEVSGSASQKFIHQYTKKGLFIKLRNGLYALKNENISVFQVANKLYSPSYISLEAALSYYNILPEAAYGITSVTAKPNREFVALNLSFTYSRIKRSCFRGYYLQTENDHSFLIAEPEKALADYLYLVSLNKKALNQRLDTSKLNKDKIKNWSDLFHSSKLENLISDIC